MAYNDTKCLHCVTEELGMEGADLPGAPALMSRTSWVAQPSKAPLDDNSLPADMVVVCHTATETCNTTANCILSVRLIQQFHIESRGWNDIAYNYLVGGDNRVYVGRGWEKMGAHTKGYNKATVGVAFIGTFDNQLPPSKQLEAFRKLLDLGVRLGKLTKDYKLVAQCQLSVTAAPGAAVVKEIASWPHYDATLPTTGCTTL